MPSFTPELALSALEHIQANVFLTDLNHRVIYCNTAQLNCTNSTAETVFGKHLSELQPPDLAAKLIDNNNLVIEQKKKLNFAEYCSWQGKETLMLSEKSPFYHDGKCIGVIGIAMTAPNISHSLSQNQKNKDLNDLELIQQIASLEAHPTRKKIFIEQNPGLLMRYIDTILDIMPGSFFCIDKNNKVLAANNYQAKIFGLKHRNDVINMHIKDIPGFTDEISEKVIKNNKQVLKSNQLLAIKEFACGKTFLSYKMRITDQKKQPLGLVGMALDITELTEAQAALAAEKKKLQQISQAKTRFLMNISHDIRTPCSGIAGLADLLHSTETCAEKREYLKDIKSSITQLTNLLNQIIDHSRYENGVIPIKKSTFSLKQLIDDIIDLYKPEAKQKNLSLTATCTIDGGNIYSDQQRIQQILVNLVGNAIKFTEHGSILINAQKNESDDAVTLSVQDTGDGIPEAEQQNIFEAFTRLSPSYANKKRGSGLGLHLVKELMNDLNGDINVKSIPGEGSHFSCRIPLNKPPTIKSTLTKQTSAAYFSCGLNLKQTGNEKNILLIEDDLIAQKVNAFLLKQFGCKVDTAQTADEALKKNLSQYDLIITDIGLPDMDGFTLTKAIRKALNQNKPQIPIIGLTAHLNTGCHQNATQAGLDWITTKPLTEKIIDAL